MKMNRRNISTVFLILGIASLAVGISIDNTVFSWAAVVFIVISLVAGGKWTRMRKHK